MRSYLKTKPFRRPMSDNEANTVNVQHVLGDLEAVPNYEQGLEQLKMARQLGRGFVRWAGDLAKTVGNKRKRTNSCSIM